MPEMAEKIALCEYADCDTQLPAHLIEDMRDDDGAPIYICERCENLMGDETGYCSVSCQLGYGCDQSC